MMISVEDCAVLLAMADEWDHIAHPDLPASWAWAYAAARLRSKVVTLGEPG